MDLLPQHSFIGLEKLTKNIDPYSTSFLYIFCLLLKIITPKRIIIYHIDTTIKNKLVVKHVKKNIDVVLIVTSNIGYMEKKSIMGKV